MARAEVYGVEPFDAGYGTELDLSGDSVADVECEIVEGDGTWAPTTPSAAAPPGRLAFVDGTMRTEARLTRRDADGRIVAGVAGSWAAGAVLAAVDEPLVVDRVRCGRMTVGCAGRRLPLPEQPGGWSWEALAVEAADVEAARGRLRRRMRDEEARIAEQLCEEGWQPVVDGPLANVRRRTGVALIGYVKTHHRRVLAEPLWRRVPELEVGSRSPLFALDADRSACYLRVGSSGPWSSPWAGIARLEVPSGAGRSAAIAAVDAAAAWLPRYATRPHRDARAPVNLAPIARLERVLRRRAGEQRLAVRAVRQAVVQINAAEAKGAA